MAFFYVRMLVKYYCASLVGKRKQCQANGVKLTAITVATNRRK